MIAETLSKVAFPVHNYVWISIFIMKLLHLYIFANVFSLLCLILSATKYQTVEHEIIRSNTPIPMIQQIFQKKALYFESEILLLTELLPSDWFR